MQDKAEEEKAEQEKGNLPTDAAKEIISFDLMPFDPFHL